MMDQLKSILDDKTQYALVALVLGALAGAYNVGYRAGYAKAYIPKSKMCEKEIEQVGTLEGDLATCETQKAAEVLQCKTDCVSKVCRPLCIKDVAKAVENYKKLRRCK